MLCALSGGILLADWQAIPSDPCTKYSPFHHPGLIENYTAEHRSAPSWRSSDAEVRQPPSQINISESVSFNDKIQADLCFPRLYSDTKYLLECSEVDSCINCVSNKDVTTASHAGPSVFCFSLSYRGDKLHVLANCSDILLVHKSAAVYECRVKYSEYCVCVMKAESRDSATDLIDDSHSIGLQRRPQPAASIQSLEMIKEDIYNIAVNKCESLYSMYGCHWIPQSRITGELCTDCPPICRSVYRTLTFIQFCIGAVLIKISLPTSRVSAVNLLTDVVDKDIQVRKNN